MKRWEQTSSKAMRLWKAAARSEESKIQRDLDDLEQLDERNIIKATFRY